MNLSDSGGSVTRNSSDADSLIAREKSSEPALFAFDDDDMSPAVEPRLGERRRRSSSSDGFSRADVDDDVDNDTARRSRMSDDDGDAADEPVDDVGARVGAFGALRFDAGGVPHTGA